VGVVRLMVEVEVELEELRKLVMEELAEEVLMVSASWVVGQEVFCL
jgi:hypothetical protein